MPSPIQTRHPRVQPEGQPSLRPVAIWLFVMCALVALMVTVGGATRLTDSGLSITEWKPIIGTLPPLSQAAWLAEFEKYQKIPEYREVNFGMSLDAFKRIYWWEWGHRFLGRFLGVAFAIPLVIFALMGRVTGALRWQLPALLMLGAMQGLLGWYMVKSGLSERVDVSQYRLAAHLGLAIILFGLIAGLAFRLRRNFTDNLLSDQKVSVLWPSLLLVGVYVQMILGAFVAGLRAGRTFNTWPLMDGKFIPDGYFPGTVHFSALFESIAAVQFNHRMGAYLLLAGVIAYAWHARASVMAGPARWLALGVTGQALLGIITLVAGTPLWLGLLHQACAMFVFFIAVWMVERAYFLRYGVNASRSMVMSGRAGSTVLAS